MDRQVKATRRDASGKIIALCNAGQSWSPRKVSSVVKELDAGTRSYYVQEGSTRTYVRVIEDGSLQTTPDEQHLNHLQQLPSTR